MSTFDPAWFTEDYASARDLFRAACAGARADVQTLRNPAVSRVDVELATDVVRFGPRDANKLLVLISGVHGVETLAGSGCQVGLMSGGHLRSLPTDTAVVLVHAINCWGAANLRRHTEGNVDLCRNFLDFSQPVPHRPAYEEIHGALSCAERTGPAREAADAFLAEYRRTRGLAAWMEALMGGQYEHADGFEYGGREPVWSNRTIGAILADHAGIAEHVCIVEYHTGLGPYGYGTAVTMHTGAALERARRWFGQWVLAPNHKEPGAAEEFYRVHGHSTEGYLDLLGDRVVTSMVLEYGTYPPTVTLPAMLADHWLANHGDPGSDEGRTIRTQLLRAHYPQDNDWRRAIWDRSQQMVAQCLRGLAES